ncbi:MAG: matrixin family metalloprotease [Rubrobacteraceae bacterium]
MKFAVVALSAALVLSLFAVGAAPRNSGAQTRAVLEACREGWNRIPAGKLPSKVDLERCPVENRPIVDGGVEVVLPKAGEGVHAEILSTNGSQELEVARRKNGTVELDEVGNEAKESLPDKAAPIFYAASRGPGACRDPAYKLTGWRIYGTVSYRYNNRRAPRHLNPRAARRAVRKAGSNMARNHNSCRLRDQVEARLAFRGKTRRVANIKPNGRCGRTDRKSVVSFGRLRGRQLAVTCTYFKIRKGFDRVTAADIKIDRSNVRWTTRPRGRSCRRAFDLQSVLTHEFGHAFGLGHVSERAHPNQTMSPRINGPCQRSERSLGKGDVRGLARKYR